MTKRKDEIRPGRFEYWKSKGLWYSRIIAANGETVYTSEGVKNKRDCLSTIAGVNVGGWPVELRGTNSQ